MVQIPVTAGDRQLRKICVYFDTTTPTLNFSTEPVTLVKNATGDVTISWSVPFISGTIVVTGAAGTANSSNPRFISVGNAGVTPTSVQVWRFTQADTPATSDGAVYVEISGFIDPY